MTEPRSVDKALLVVEGVEIQSSFLVNPASFLLRKKKLAVAVVG